MSQHVTRASLHTATPTKLFVTHHGVSGDTGGPTRSETKKHIKNAQKYFSGSTLLHWDRHFSTIKKEHGWFRERDRGKKGDVGQPGATTCNHKVFPAQTLQINKDMRTPPPNQASPLGQGQRQGHTNTGLVPRGAGHTINICLQAEDNVA